MGDLYGMIVSSFKKPENMLSDTEEKVTIAFFPPPELSGLSGVSGALCLLAPLPPLCLPVLCCSLFTLRSGIQVHGD